MPGQRALFLDFGGTLVVVRDGRTVVDAGGNPILCPHVTQIMAKTRPFFDACFIVSNQARIGKGEISRAEAPALRLAQPAARRRQIAPALSPQNPSFLLGNPG